MDDGLYAVSWGSDDRPVHASFEIRDGMPYRVAPIIRKRLTYWMTKAKRIGVRCPRCNALVLDDDLSPQGWVLGCTKPRHR